MTDLPTSETESPSLRAYEADIAAQKRARFWGRVATAIGLLAGAAYAFYDSVTTATMTPEGPTTADDPTTIDASDTVEEHLR
jgi:hypothetical protein